MSDIQRTVQYLQPFSNRNTLPSQNEPGNKIQSLLNKSENDVWDESYKQNAFVKQKIPWKTFRYLGYKPSMRQYMHEIYTPVGKRPSMSPLALSSIRRLGTTNLDLTKFDKSANNQRDKIFVEKSTRNGQFKIRDLNPIKEKPKLAIVSSYETVVKAKVTIKTVVVR